MTRINHTRHSHPATSKARAICRQLLDDHFEGKHADDLDYDCDACQGIDDLTTDRAEAAVARDTHPSNFTRTARRAARTMTVDDLLACADALEGALGYPPRR